PPRGARPPEGSRRGGRARAGGEPAHRAGGASAGRGPRRPGSGARDPGLRRGARDHADLRGPYRRPRMEDAVEREPGGPAHPGCARHGRAHLSPRMTAASDRARRRGRLKIFLGYAAGVGKTFRMLEEGGTLRRAGRDVVVGYFEPHARHETIAKMEGLELVPRRRIEYRGCLFEEMDTDAVLARGPEVCLVDEFAHTNVPGSARAKRWEDVVVLVD